MPIEEDIAALKPTLAALLKQVKEMRITHQTLGTRIESVERTIQGFATSLDDIQTALDCSLRR